MSRPASPGGQASRHIAISPFSTSVNGRTASAGTGPTATVRVMSVVPSRYCAAAVDEQQLARASPAGSRPR